MKISVKGFAGMTPAISPRLIGENKSQWSSNVIVGDGHLKPARSSEKVTATNISSRPRTIFVYRTHDLS